MKFSIFLLLQHFLYFFQEALHLLSAYTFCHVEDLQKFLKVDQNQSVKLFVKHLFNLTSSKVQKKHFENVLQYTLLCDLNFLK